MLKTIYDYIEGYDLTITFRRKESNLVMIIVPSIRTKDKDLEKEVKKMLPLTISGNPEVIEDNFAEIISNSLSIISGLQDNIEEFEKKTKKISDKVAEKTGKPVISAEVKPPEKQNDLFAAKSAEKPVPAEPKETPKGAEETPVAESEDFEPESQSSQDPEPEDTTTPDPKPEDNDVQDGVSTEDEW